MILRTVSMKEQRSDREIEYKGADWVATYEESGRILSIKY